jgi:hypothetical protein
MICGKVHIHRYIRVWSFSHSCFVDTVEWQLKQTKFSQNFLITMLNFLFLWKPENAFSSQLNYPQGWLTKLRFCISQNLAEVMWNQNFVKPQILQNWSLVPDWPSLCPLSTANCFLPTVHFHCLVSTAAHCFRLVPSAQCPVCCPMPTVYCPLFTAHYLLPTVYCPRFSAHCFLPTFYWPILIAHCSLANVHCSLSSA